MNIAFGWLAVTFTKVQVSDVDTEMMMSHNT